MYGARLSTWVGQNMEYVFAMTESTSKQIFPTMVWSGSNSVTRENVPQTSLTFDSSATIHFSAIKNFYKQAKRAII